MNENDLLRRFAEENDQEAFAGLVRTKINLVYSVALRRVGDDAHLAQDVTQSVFLALALQAGKLKRHPMLTGWLFTTVHFLSAKAVRERRRWENREVQAQEICGAATESDAGWRELRPVVDDVLRELSEKDRAALLLRFFEDRSHADVGAALGVSENAARMRTERALEKLRSKLSRRGITSTAAALGTVLGGGASLAAPAGLASAVTATALAGVGAGLATGVCGAGGAIFGTMSVLKLVVGLATAGVLFGSGAFAGGRISRACAPASDGSSCSDDQTTVSVLQAENATLKTRLEALKPATVEGEKAPAEADAAGARNKWKLVAEMAKQGVIKPSVTFVDPAGKLNGYMANLFDLTSAEQKAIAQTLETARAELDALEAANATVTRVSKDVVRIDVKPFPMAGIAKALGKERNDAFLLFGSEQVERSYRGVGSQTRTVTVTSQPDLRRSRYLATDKTDSPGNRHSSSGTYPSRENLEKHLGSIVRLLPEGF